MTVRLMGFPTRETNSSQASSSRGPAQRQMTSCRDKDEYRVGLGVFDIFLFLVSAPAPVDWMILSTLWSQKTPSIAATLRPGMYSACRSCLIVHGYRRFTSAVNFFSM